MLPETFRDALSRNRNRVPFKPFFVELVSGRVFAVHHPEALAIGNRMAVYVSPNDESTFLDHESVASVSEDLDLMPNRQ